MTRCVVTPAGTRFGRLTTLDEAPKAGMKVRCRCDCGAEVSVLVISLRCGNSTTCGCSKKGAGNGRYRHGMAGSSIYMTWTDMVGRCTRQTHKRFADYGGRGITVCDRWLVFDNFYADMGDRPAGLTLDRRDNDKGYELGNCRWTDLSTQARNRRTSGWERRSRDERTGQFLPGVAA